MPVGLPGASCPGMSCPAGGLAGLECACSPRSAPGAGPLTPQGLGAPLPHGKKLTTAPINHPFVRAGGAGLS